MKFIKLHSIVCSSFMVLPVLIAAGCTPSQKTEHAAEGSAEQAKEHAEKPVVTHEATAHHHDAAPHKADTAAPASAPVSALTPEASAAVREVLTAYKDLHALLAADKVEGVAETATRLEQAASRAAALVPTGLQAQLQTASESTSHITQGHAKTLEEMRSAFGGVSRAIIFVLGAEPTLAKGLNVIECPMATGYKKWVQDGDTVSNPYMGVKMATCGVKSTWNE